jgi:hypothetical protein
LQNKPSLQAAVLFVPPQVPPAHTSVDVQTLPSSHDVPFASFAVQLSAASLQLSLQFGPVLWPGHGLPAWLEQDPPAQVSLPLQNKPSLHAAVLFVPPHVPAVQVSLDVHTLPSLQPVPFGSGAVQLSAPSLHDVAQLLSVVTGAGHGSPAWFAQDPPLQVSAPLQKSPSLQPVPFGSGAVHALAPSLQDAEQFPSFVLSGVHGSPACSEQPPPLHVSLPLQKTPSLQAAELFVPPHTPPVH